ncbi:hypothetical protein P152DRAFT_505479 [Eremomyces bilateralis CBS 781.70]|uniref:SGF29 C-terminal domain-containing protein n=1 Tax=Eremomyces bilateralis CBS 781.70 TaxID=1392243 RepID=A0A6G1GCJ5_9PEZI|nr:uncharacterized protein P152DRAFT_505479 [Eremomyces bilateralis CBS 781.70]KAF1815621.1 hypothetical protein P152DRAFT_505479 [Eremomyces bilateralis CBS 781.70]
MASRNRRPNAVKDDADEERGIWNQLRSDAKRVDTLMAGSNTRWERMAEIHNELNAAHGRGVSPTSDLEDELSSLSRENIRLIEEITSACDGETDDNNLSILRSLEVLGALRASSEADTAATTSTRTSAAASAKSQRLAKRKDRDRDRERGMERERERERERGEKRSSIESGTPVAEERGESSVAGESPRTTASPKVEVKSSVSRLMSKAGSRSGSVGAGRESSVKAEDGDEKEAPKVAERHPKLTVGTEVLYRAPTAKNQKSKLVDRDPSEGEGILCSITSVIGEGKQRRYEIQDSDPDPPTPPTPYRASVAHLIPIPASNDGLRSLSMGTSVLALYPSTTTFYRAEVVRVRDGGEVMDGWVRLRFEGEDEEDKEETVERRYVLPDVK